MVGLYEYMCVVGTCNILLYVGESFEWEGYTCMFCFFSTTMVGVGIS